MSHALPYPLSLAMNNPMNTMQTPVQAQFFQPVPGFIPGHNVAQRGSIAGPIFPIPPAIGQTPLTPGFPVGIQPPPHMVPPTQPAAGGHGRTGSMSLPVNRNRRQPSISTGGPPKATLGGPMNKHVAAPLTNPASSAAVLEKTLKGKKLVVKVPKETPTDNGVVPDFARHPVPTSDLAPFEDPQSIDIQTAVIHPEERLRGDFPKTVDVFLPGKGSWDELKRKMIDEKLSKLGVEVNFPTIFTNNPVHGRAASISSPADPNLLMFKLNRLRQFQNQDLSPNMTPSSHLSASPAPRPQTGSPSPNHLLGPSSRLNMPANHRNAMSLSTTGALYNPSGSFNPFGPTATLGSDQIISPALSTGSGRGRLPEEQSAATSEEGRIFAPRGVHGRLGATLTKPDFIRGFGLDITEETEEELEEVEAASQTGMSDRAVSELAEVLQDELDAIPELDEPASVANSRRHSRHTSRVSAALSLRSLGRGGKSDSGILEEDEKENEADGAIRAWESEGAARSPEDEDARSPANGWAGSDDESVGEFSNPSDEERARELKRARKQARAGHGSQQGSRSNFSRPGEHLDVPRINNAHDADSEEIVSNPSDDEMYRHKSTSRPLPAIPTSATHSRNNSGHVYVHSRSGSGHILPHAIPLPHSRGPSGQFATGGSSHGTPPVASPGYAATGFAINHRDSLNPHAAPFVFGKPWYSSTAAPATPPVETSTFAQQQQQPPTSGAHRLNATATEFKPSISAAEFKPSFAAPEFKPSTTAPEFKPSTTAPEFKPSPAAAEFRSTLAAPVFEPKLPPIEFGPSGLTGAFKSNPGSGDFTIRTTSGEPAVAPAASEFTFEPPPVAPKLAFPPPAVINEPAQPVNAHGRAIQGREKRQRTGSDVDAEPTANESVVEAAPAGADVITWGQLSEFTFPHEEGEEKAKEEAPVPTQVSDIKPFVFPPPKRAATVAVRAASPEPIDLTPEPAAEFKRKSDYQGLARSPKPPPLTDLPRRESDNERPISSGASSARALPQPPQRAQTLLSDFKPHSVSSNTVPVSLFKNLGHDRSRATSRDLSHSGRPSLDDVHMPMIARYGAKVVEAEPKPIAVEKPVDKPTLVLPENPIPQLKTSPTPPSPSGSSDSEVSRLGVGSIALSPRMDSLIDEKMEALRQDVRTLVEAHLLKMNTTTSNRAEEALMRIARLMREQAAERQDSKFEPLNSTLVRTIVEDSSKEVTSTIQRELSEFAHLLHSNVKRTPGEDIIRLIEEQASRVITAVSGATHTLAARLEVVHSLVNQPAPAPAQAAHARAPSHESLLRVLRPHLEQLRAVPFDVDVVTSRLAEAVKPTLADFIDLASDKGETAELIVAKLAPVLASLQSSRIETQEIANQLAEDISRLVPPVDSVALTEQVADLVVERLDSRLTVREKGMKPDAIAQKVVEVLQPQLSTASREETASNHTESIMRSLDALSKRVEQALHAATHAKATAQHSTVQSDELAAILLELRKLGGVTESQASLVANVSELRPAVLSEITTLHSTLTRGQEAISASQATLVEVTQQTQNMVDSGMTDVLHTQELHSGHLQDVLANSAQILKEVSILPHEFGSTQDAIRALHSELASKLRTLPDIIELQNQRHDLQVQLSKARSSHGQVRSEKDLLAERIASLEAERERLRMEVQATQGLVAAKDAELAAAGVKTEQAEKALQQSLLRIETSEAVSKMVKEQIARLETANRELQKTNNERQAKIDSLELQMTFANRDKETAKEALARVEQERDATLEQQQDAWRENKLMSQKLDSLMQLLMSKESDELRELRRQRDKSKVMEAELSAAKKRTAELESKLELLVRSEAKTNQSLEDSRRQVDEYEDKVEKLEKELEPLRRLDTAQKTRDREFEQIRSQLQHQEKQENHLRQTNIMLEEELTTVRNELELLQKAQATAKWQHHQSKEPTAPAYARAAPTVNGRSSAVSGAHSSRSNTPPATYNGVWQSRHAPSKPNKAPQGYQSVPRSTAPSSKANHSSSGYRRAASPAQSVVSQAPTLRENGWWE